MHFAPAKHGSILRRALKRPRNRATCPRKAKESQSLNEGRIEDLKAILDNAVIISKASAGGAVSVGSLIRVQNGGEAREFMIVGASEADPANGKISNESPLGSAFLGRKKGEKVKVATPKGTVEYKVIEVK